VYAQTEKAD